MTIRMIKQRHSTGCAVASLAMVSGISYNKAYKTLCPSHQYRKRLPLIYIGDLITALNKANKKAFYIRARSFYRGVKRSINIKELNKRSIILIDMPSDMNHAVVWDPISKKILDPSNLAKDELSFYQEHMYGVIVVNDT